MMNIKQLNRMMRDNTPLDKMIKACAWIDIESCFNPIFEPPLDFLEECRRRQEEKFSPFRKTVERKIGNTWYLIETECAGEERLSDKVKRLIFSDKGVVCS